MRTRKTNIGNAILDFLVAEQQLYPGDREMRYVIEDCMIYGSVELLDRVLEYRKGKEPEHAEFAVMKGLPISNHELNTLFQQGCRSGFLTLLRNRLIDPNRLGRHLTLDRALYCCRYDLVHLLLDNGTDIDATDDDGNTALQHAVCRGYLPNIKFLIENGADPSRVTDGYSDVLQFCQRAAAHANGAKLNGETWRSFWVTLDWVDDLVVEL